MAGEDDAAYRYRRRRGYRASAHLLNPLLHMLQGSELLTTINVLDLSSSLRRI
jgi:hypothetical protein